MEVGVDAAIAMSVGELGCAESGSGCTERRTPSSGIPRFNLANHRLRAELIERLCQLRGDRLRIAGLDVGALHHVHQLAIAQKTDGW
jgi:hypothetical protein